jgi:hypothetical protein
VRSMTYEPTLAGEVHSVRDRSVNAVNLVNLVNCRSAHSEMPKTLCRLKSVVRPPLAVTPTCAGRLVGDYDPQTLGPARIPCER